MIFSSKNESNNLLLLSKSFYQFKVLAPCRNRLKYMNELEGILLDWQIIKVKVKKKLNADPTPLKRLAIKGTYQCFVLKGL